MTKSRFPIEPRTLLMRALLLGTCRNIKKRSAIGQLEKNTAHEADIENKNSEIIHNFQYNENDV